MSTVSIVDHMWTMGKMANDKLEIVDTLPKPETLPDGSYYGYYSVTLPNKVKVIPYHYVKQVDDELDTETGFTRKFLKKFPRRKVRHEEYMSYRNTRPPLYIRPSILENAVYVDLRQAYPSIYKYLGWMTDYCRGKYWGVGDKMPYPFDMSWKAGRSYIVTGARHVQYGRYILSGEVKVKPYASPFSNPPLVAGVYDVLSSVARFAQYALQCRYWNVDGGIIPEKALQIFIPFVESIGLEARVKYQGKATVLSSGYWKIGSHETKRWESNMRSGVHGGDYISTSKEDAEWIYKQYRKIWEHNKDN